MVMAGFRKYIKLDDLTPEIYLRYKRTGMDDREIGRLYDVTGETISNWKADHGLKGVSIREWSTWEKYFPKDVEKLKKKYMELWNRGWKRQYIAEEMDMSHGALTRFVERFLPHMKQRTVKHRLTDEQKRIAHENGIKIDTAQARIRAGVSVEEAITKPTEEKIGSMTAGSNRKWKDLSDDMKRKAIQNKITQSTVTKRLGRGWPDELAVTKPPKKCGNGKVTK
jgi:hypothetical protein